MGADFIGWRGCALQDELGPDVFLSKIKLGAYRRLIEERVPDNEKPKVKVRVAVTGREPRELTYDGILAELGGFEQGIPDCENCPLSGGKAIGCYHYITYPIDEVTEELLFEYFCSKVTEPESIPNQIWLDIISTIEGETPWHENRGPEGSLAQRSAPLSATLVWENEEHSLDSAQLLAGLFIDLDEPPLLVAYALFFNQFVEYVRTRIGLKEDGSIELTVDGSGNPSEEELQARAQAAFEQVKHIADSRTLGELQEVAPMLMQAAARAMDEGYRVLVDG